MQRGFAVIDSRESAALSPMGADPASGPGPRPVGGWPGGNWPGGNWIVVGLVGVALALALFALWFHSWQTRRCLDFFGGTVAHRIQVAPRVELWDPVDAGPTGQFDVSAAPGLVHLRRGLVEDANFAWNRGEAAVVGPSRTVALAFYDTVEASLPQSVLLFTFGPDCGTVSVADRPERLPLGRIRPGLLRWLEAVRPGFRLEAGEMPAETGLLGPGDGPYPPP